MQNPPPKLVPLTDDERAWLLTIYNTRLRNLLVAFLASTLALTFISFSRLGFVIEAMINDLILDGKETWLVDQHFLSGWYIKILIAILIAGIFSIMSYCFNMLPYKADAISGVKINVPIVIVKKERFPLTEQYFIWLAGFTEKHFEID